MKKYVLIFFLFVTGFGYSQTQEATLYFKDGTSWKGYAKIVSRDFDSNYKIKFRFNKDDKAEIWGDLMLKGVTFHGFEMDLKYEYHRIKENQRYPLLLEIVTEGNVTMYADVYKERVNNLSQSNFNDGLFPFNGFNTHESTKTVIYFKRENEEYVTKLKGRFKKSVISYFGNCSGLIEGIDNHEFRRATLLEMVEYYNDFCAD